MFDFPATTARSRYLDGFLVFVVLFGAALRVLPFAEGRPLWHDEAMIALNLFRRSYQDLLLPLDYDQSAPLLWLFGTKFVIGLFGPGEMALRLIPLLAGIGSLVLFALTVRRSLDGVGAALAVTLFAIAMPLVYYAAEAKQYATDVLVVSLFLWLLAGRGQGLLRSWGGVALLAGAGAVSVLLSLSAVFVLFGAGLALAVRPLQERDGRAVLRLACIGAVWLLCFGAVSYLATSDSGTLVAAMRRYWSEWFIPPALFIPSRFIAAVRIMLQVPEGMGFPASSVMLLLLFAALGLYDIWQRSRVLVLFLALTLLGTVAASMAQFYPMTARFVLFLAPGLIYVLAAGVSFTLRMVPRLRWPVAGVVALLLGLMGFETAAHLRITPAFAREEIDRSIADVVRRKQPDDLVYVYYAAVPAFQIYGKALAAAPGGVVYGRDMRSDWSYMLADMLRICGRRVWFLWSHPIDRNGVDDVRFFEFVAGKLGQVVERNISREAGAVLIDLTEAGRCDAMRIEEPQRPWVPGHPGFRPLPPLPGES
ncbi:glycosyltransferase family 39 protein [Belnapia sp. F-4-1]|uniref:glycosyltransferase family 39 protein n=1 Tax=Belnapia sp. F-4-1 TaxID=1545443 RepID=UPI0005BDDA45|nr:glycosyltransferase family 39 protein [Belnapia sp. F-4-1]